MSRTDHFPRLNIHSGWKANKDSLAGRETVEEFVARGGKIDKIPTGQGISNEGKGNTSQDGMGDVRRRSVLGRKIRQQDHAIGKSKGRLS